MAVPETKGAISGEAYDALDITFVKDVTVDAGFGTDQEVCLPT